MAGDWEQQKGLTLIELLVAIAILAIALSLSTGSSDFINEGRVSADINLMMDSLSFSRTEALKKAQTVTICSSSNGTSCNGGSTWESGWIVFSDADADASVDSGDGDQVLRVAEALSSGNTLRRSGFAFTAGRVQFNSRGELRGNAATAGTLAVCNSAGEASAARAVVIQISGAVRKAVDENNDGIVNSHSGAGSNVTCP